MSDETRAKLLEAVGSIGQAVQRRGEEGNYTAEWNDIRAALTAHEQAVATEAVLAFADALDSERPAASIHRFQHRAAQFLAAQGWSETTGQAERGKP